LALRFDDLGAGVDPAPIADVIVGQATGPPSRAVGRQPDSNALIVIRGGFGWPGQRSGKDHGGRQSLILEIVAEAVPDHWEGDLTYCPPRQCLC